MTVSTTANQPAGRLNVLLITTDQQRWDTLPCYGLDFIHTPHLDRLAREGLVFERCYTTAPLCVPARAALMGGQWPSTTGVLGNSHWLPESQPVWPQRCFDAGLRTGAIGKMHFHPWDARHGFLDRISAEDKRHTYLPDDHAKFLRAHGIERPHPTALPGYFEWLQASVTPWPKRFHADAFVGDQAAWWLGTYGTEPFAAWVSFPGPHDPYDPPEEMAAMYYDAPIPEPVGAPGELETKPRAQRGVGRSSLNNGQYRIDPSQATPEQIRRWRAHYYANISLIDEGIGKMVDALERTGALDRTLIIFTSDHGDALGDHGLVYKSFFYDCMARVPLIIRGPGVAAGARCRSLVSTLDLVPLIYRATGVTPPDTLQGADMAPALADPQHTIRDVVFSEASGRIMVRDDRWKYVHYANGDAELYDMVADPDERHNLAWGDRAGQHRAEIARLRALLIEHSLDNWRYQARAVAKPAEPQRVSLELAYRKERGLPLAGEIGG